MNAKKPAGLGIGVVLLLTGLFGGRGEAAAVVARLNYCDFLEGALCVTEVTVYTNSTCSDPGGPYDYCTTCYADPNALCPTPWYDVASARDVE